MLRLLRSYLQRSSPMNGITWIWAGDTALLAFFADEPFAFFVNGKDEATRLLFAHCPDDERRPQIHKSISDAQLLDFATEPTVAIRGSIVGKFCSLLITTSNTLGGLIWECADNPTPSTMMCFGLSGAKPPDHGYIGYCDDAGKH